MDSQIHKQNVPVLRPLLHACEEIVISNDFVLPEYCPDIAVVLKCVVTPYIHSRQWSGNQLLLDGNATIRVLYLDEERCSIHKAEFSYPLSLSVRREDVSKDPMAEITVRQDYLNCRATSPRRLEVRGGFVVCVEAVCSDTVSMLAEDCKGVHVRRQAVNTSTVKAFTEKVIALNDVLDVNVPTLMDERLLHSSSRACVNDCKLLAGKVIVKGTVYFCYFYDNGEGGICPVEYAMPYSQILDVDGAEDGDACTAHVTVLSEVQRVAPSGDGHNATLELGVKLLLQVQVYGCQTVSIVTDAYHCGCPSSLSTQDLSLRGLLGVQHVTTALQTSLDWPAGDVRDVLALWLQPLATTCDVQAGKARVCYKVNVCMLVRDTNGLVAYFERPEELVAEHTVAADALSAEVVMTDFTYTATDGGIGLRVELHQTLALWSEQSCKAVLDVQLQTENPYPNDKTAVHVYYAKAGESVWDIARECRTSPQCIAETNALREDKLYEDTVLLVPVC